MRRAIACGLAYGFAAMLAGTVLGVIRTLWLAPRVGETLAVLIELPLILAFAWAVCGWLIGRWPLGPGWRQAAIMGAVAFIALITLEFLAASWLAGRPPEEVMAAWASPAGALGLVGQLVFAAFPLLQQRKGAGGVSMERESG